MAKRILITAGLFIVLVVFLVWRSRDRISPLFYNSWGDIVSVTHESLVPTEGVAVHLVRYRREYWPAPATLSVFEFTPGLVKLELGNIGRPPTTVGKLEPGYILAINACYFDASNRPVMMLREGRHVIHKRVRTNSAFFWYRRNGRMGITHARSFRDRPDYDLVIQSTPRLIAGGRPTRGLADVNTVNLRTGLGILENGHLIVYATGASIGSGLSYAELRQIMLDRFKIDSLLCLDGGASVQFAFKEGDLELGTTGYRAVPVFLLVERQK